MAEISFMLEIKRDDVEASTVLAINESVSWEEGMMVYFICLEITHMFNSRLTGGCDATHHTYH